VANFSAWGTTNPRDPSAEYRVLNWPATPDGKHWREVTQERDIPDAWVAREPLYPWEAKVYVLADR
jgi:pullulanase